MKARNTHFSLEWGAVGAPKDTAVLDKSPSTAYEYMVDLFPCTTAIGIPSPAVGLWNQGPAILILRLLEKVVKSQKTTCTGPRNI